MAEAFSGVGIPVVGGVVRIVFGAVVVGEFEDALTIRPVGFVRESIGRVIGEEVEVEIGSRLGDLLDEG